MAVKKVANIPMPLKGETDDEYMARLEALGITGADLDAAMEEEMPLSDNDVTTSIEHDGDYDKVATPSSN